MHTFRSIVKTAYWLIAALIVLGGLLVTLRMGRIHQHDQLIVRIAREYELDPRLISAVIWKESRYDAAAVGTVGEIGLMQVTETVGQEWAKQHGRHDFMSADLFDPEINIRAGTWYLARGIRQWSSRPDPLPYALAQYNAGRSNALRWAKDDEEDPGRFIRQVTYPGTRVYITDILTRYRGRV